MTAGGLPGLPQGSGAAAKPPTSVGEFVKQVTPQAELVAKQLGVPVDAVIGQWGLETGWGKSVIPGTNNLGNIKDFSGKGPTARDNMTGSIDAYRKYDSPEAFAQDFTGLLGNRRYAAVRNAADPTAYFTALKQGGYAEDPDYVRKGAAAAQMVAAARSQALATGTPPPPAVAAQLPKAERPIGAFNSPALGTGEKTQTTALTFAGNGPPKPAEKPLTVPKDVKWSEPVTVVQADLPKDKPQRGVYKAVATIRATDGDGVKLSRDGGKSEFECRLDSIDAPETAKPWKNQPDQSFGQEAKATLQSLIANKQVTVRVSKSADEGKYGRTYCQIEIEGVGLDRMMLEKGAAWLYRKYNNDPGLAKAEAEAKQAKRGLWAGVNPEDPEQYRRRYPG